ncbi:hypothetical protein LCGC14_3013850, partial [marine sediment metagenome]
EYCCDELAISATGKRLAYVSALERVARLVVGGRTAPAAAAFAGARPALLDRVRHVLGASGTSDTSGRWLAGVVVAALAALLIGVASYPDPATGGGVVTFGTPGFRAEDGWQSLKIRVSPKHRWQPSMSWVYGKMHRLRKSFPGGAEFPAELGHDPLFTAWPCARAKAGHIMIALSKSRQGGPYDRAYMDMDADGSFADETLIRSDKPSYSRVNVQWHPEFTLADKSGSSQHKLGLYRMKTNDVSLWIRSELWREGAVKVAGKKRRCVVADFSLNGAFNDVSGDLFAGDRIALEIDGRLVTHVLGGFIDIEGALYRPEVSIDGSAVRFVSAGDVPMATVRMPEGMTELTLFGTNGTFKLRPAAA